MQYTDKLSNEKVTLTPREDLLVVKLDRDTAGDLQSLSASGLRPALPLQEGQTFGLYQVTGERSDVEETLEEDRAVAGSLTAFTDGDGNERYLLPGEVTVQFREEVKGARQLELIESLGATVLKKQWTPGYYRLSAPNGDVFGAIEAFNALEEVLFAEGAEVGFNDDLYLPNDTRFGEQWALHNTGQTGGTSDADVDAPAAWDSERGDPNVVIAVIDTGVDLDHPDLLANLVPQPAGEDWDFADNDLIPEDGGSHGTHCAGIAAGVDNAGGVLGMAPGCRILPIRIDLQAGMNANRADAINFVTSIRGRFTQVVINCSWKASGNITAIRNAIVNATNQGVLVVFAAGNANRDMDVQPQFPGAYAQVVSVAATNHRDERAWFSNYGSTVDVSAPGMDILSTVPGGGYGLNSGTSMAAPLVAGLAALVWSKNPALTSQEVRTILQGSCDDIDARNPNFVGDLGAGRVNAARALRDTPVHCRFRPEGHFPFPQPNAGSSSALAFYSKWFRIPAFPPPRPIGKVPVAVGAGHGVGVEPAAASAEQVTPPTLQPRPPIWWPPVRRNLLFLTQKAGAERIYFLDPSTGKVVRSVQPEKNITIGSMAWDGKRIRVANVTTGAGSVNSIDPSTGAQTGSVAVPPGRGEGMAWDGSSLFYSTVSRIHQLDGSTGRLIRSFPVPGGGQCRALASDGGNLLFAGDKLANQITVFEKGSLRVLCQFDAPGTGAMRVEGLAFDRSTKRLYIANQSENRIYYGTFTQ